MTFDSTILTVLNQLPEHWSWFGLVAMFAAVPLLWLLIGWYVVAFVWFKRGGWRELTALVAGVVAAYLASAAVGHLWFRVRPFAVGAAHLMVNPPYELKSFPSDHATAAFFVALLLTAHRPRWWWSYLVALAVAVGRVAVGVHYPTDVLAGAVLGTLFGFATLTVEAWLVNSVKSKSES